MLREREREVRKRGKRMVERDRDIYRAREIEREEVIDRSIDR